LEEKWCEECLKLDIYKKGQLHHIVKRSDTSCMIHVPINFKYLCLDHHTGRFGVHNDYSKELKYKQELQLKLTLLLDKPYYGHKELKELLECSDNSIKAITKTLFRYKEGYKREDLIRHMMGDRNYLDEVME